MAPSPKQYFPKPRGLIHENNEENQNVNEAQNQLKRDGEALIISALRELVTSLRNDKTDGGSASKPRGLINEDNEENQNVNEAQNKSKGDCEALIISGSRKLITSLCNDKTDGGSASKASSQDDGEKIEEEWDKKEAALFIAAKNGVLEILEKILKDEPGAVNEINSKGQNVLHVAVKYRQPQIFVVLKKQSLWENLIRGVDDDGNTVLHLAAKRSHFKPWNIPGPAVQMQWEIKWFLYISNETPKYLRFIHSRDKETPVDIFRKDHVGLVKDGTEWLKSTYESCSVVAALIAAVAFATATTFPGGAQ